MYLTLDKVAKTFRGDGREVQAVTPISMGIARGTLVTFLGPSGCGKTTLMRLVGGLESPSAGTITLDGQPLTGPDRRRGMVFQSYAAFPWLTVAGNIRMGLKYRPGLGSDQKTALVAELISLVGLSGFEEAYTNQISGGMRQRVAIARTLAADPDVLLMDEPFGALDALTREHLQTQLLAINARETKTTIFVTHDVEEAILLADRVIVFSAGRHGSWPTSMWEACWGGRGTRRCGTARPFWNCAARCRRRCGQSMRGRCGMRDYAGKSVLVTGGNKGLGAGVARGFLRAGASVTIVGLEADVGDVALRWRDEFGAEVRGITCDIADGGAVQALAAAAPELDVLVNNAGLELITPIADPSAEVDATFRRIVEINVIGTFAVTRALLPKLRDGGRIVNTASMWGKTAVAEFSAYCASKHAVIGLTRSWAQELAPRGISVNAVCPGWVRTEASMRSLAAMAARTGRAEAALLSEVTGAQALPGLMEPEDMVDIYLFLASDAARNITGQAYTIDRGELMQ